MQKTLVTCLAGLLALQGFAGSNTSEHPSDNNVPILNPPSGGSTNFPQQKPEDRVIANIGDEQITLGEMLPTLMQSYGLEVFLLVAQRDLAEKKAAEMHIIVTPQDITAERAITMQELRDTPAG